MRTAPAKRRVCLIAHARYPVGEPRAERAAIAARDAGYAVTVVCLRSEGEAGTEVVDGVLVRRLPVSHKRGSRISRMLLEYPAFALLATVHVMALHVRRPFAVVEAHAPPDFLAVAGLIPRLFGARLVLDIRDLSPHLWDARFGGGTAARRAAALLRSVERLACRIADDVVTVHEPYRRELVRHGVEADKVVVVMNTPDERLVRPIAAAARASHDPARPFTVAYHGTITSWYGVDLLIRALALVRETGFAARGVVLGEGDALPDVEALAEELSLAEHVDFSERYLPLEEALRVVACASCGVIPNLSSELNRFILSNKLFEYVALGIPVVVARLETIAAHFDDGEVTFFEPGNERSLAAALKWVAEHPAEAAEKAARAKRRASAYSWPVSRTAYIGVLEGARG